jgi:hypothetical protein
MIYSVQLREVLQIFPFYHNTKAVNGLATVRNVSGQGQAISTLEDLHRL